MRSAHEADPNGAFGSLRVRHFGPPPLIGDNNVRSSSSTIVNAQFGYKLFDRVRHTRDVFNVLDAMETAPTRNRTTAAAFILLATMLAGPRAQSDPIPVRFPEGAVHGFLSIEALDGSIKATGDLTQQVRGEQIENKLVFHFKDGSLHDETVLFTQNGVFKMVSYRLVQHGPAFAEDVEFSLDARGKYRVEACLPGKSPATYSGKLDLPADVYNGMVLTVIKNLPKGAKRTISAVVTTPKPRVIALEIAPLKEESVTIGGAARKTVHYVMKPRLGAVLGLLVSVAGKKPRDFHSWFVMESVPAFVRFEGPLYARGRLWRIELTSPEKAD